MSRGSWIERCGCWLEPGQELKDHRCPDILPSSVAVPKSKKDRRRGNYRPERAPVKSTGHQYGDYDKPISWPEEKT